MAALDHAMMHEPLLGIASLLFIVGIVSGLDLLDLPAMDRDAS